MSSVMRPVFSTMFSTALFAAFSAGLALCLTTGFSHASGGRDPFSSKKTASCSDILIALDEHIAAEIDLRKGQIPEFKRLIEVGRTTTEAFDGHISHRMAQLGPDTEMADRKLLRKEIKYYKKARRNSQRQTMKTETGLRDAESDLADLQGRIKTLQKTKAEKGC